MFFSSLSTLVVLAVATASPSPARFQAQVNDPLLEPLAPATRQLKTWDEALRLVRERSTDDRSAVAGLERAQAQSRQALAALLPNVRLSGSVTLDLLDTSRPAMAGGTGSLPPESGATSPLGVATVTLSQSIVDVGAWRGRDATRAGERAAQASVDDIRRRLTQGLVQALVAETAAERVAQLNREGLRLALEREALTERTRQIGTATELDVVRVRQDVQVARGLVIAGDEQVRRTRDALGLALGLDHDVSVSPSFTIDALVTDSQSACTPLANVNERPELLALAAQEEAARARRLQALAGYYPSVNLQSSLFGYTTSPPVGQVASWTVSAVVSVPLWEGGLRDGIVREHEASRQQAEQALEKSRRQVSIEVSRARRAVDVAERLLATAVQARELAGKTDEMTQRSFEVGRAGSLDLVQSAQALRQADVTLAAREYESVQARADAFLTEARCDW